MMLMVKVDEFVFIYHSAPKKLFRICISYFLLVAFPMSFLPSFRTMLPESSHMKNLAGVFSRPAIRAFWSPIGQSFWERYFRMATSLWAREAGGGGGGGGGPPPCSFFACCCISNVELVILSKWYYQFWRLRLFLLPHYLTERNEKMKSEKLKIGSVTVTVELGLGRYCSTALYTVRCAVLTGLFWLGSLRSFCLNSKLKPP